MYRSGATDDLHRVVCHALTQGYEQIHLVGSMGGNTGLVYAGANFEQLPQAVQSVVAFSVPCDLRSSAYQLANGRTACFYVEIPCGI